MQRCKSAKVVFVRVLSIEYRDGVGWVGSGPRHDIVVSLRFHGGWRPRVAGDGKHFQVSGPGRQVPGSGVQDQVQVQVRDLYLYPYLITRT